MITRILISVALLAAGIPAYAADTSPLFGSSTQGPVQIAIDPHTGLPVVAETEPKQPQPHPVVASRE
jgi:hypothetical protein